MARPLGGRKKSISWSRLPATHNGRNKTITLSGKDLGKKDHCPGSQRAVGILKDGGSEILLFNHARSITRSGD
jgi:hypothetical protein